jgi:hypothetical protein
MQSGTQVFAAYLMDRLLCYAGGHDAAAAFVPPTFASGGDGSPWMLAPASKTTAKQRLHCYICPSAGNIFTQQDAPGSAATIVARASAPMTPPWLAQYSSNAFNSLALVTAWVQGPRLPHCRVGRLFSGQRLRNLRAALWVWHMLVP